MFIHLSINDFYCVCIFILKIERWRSVKDRMVLPINEKPSLTTCIHYAYPCAIIESKELARLIIDDFLKQTWNVLAENVVVEKDTNRITVKETGDNTKLVLWRECSVEDELTINIEYFKHTDQSRYVDAFLFTNNLDSEIEIEDKTLGFRWNPFGLFIKKTMYDFDTKKYKYLKIQIRDNALFGYVSDTGKKWIFIDRIDIPPKYLCSDLKIGIHLYFGHDYFKIWKYMNFIQLILNLNNVWKGINLDYYLFPRKNVDNSYGYFVNFLETHYDYTYDAIDCFGTMHDYLKWNIRHEYYVELCLDEFLVKERESYNRYHYDHYNLFYGYDDEKREYYIMGYGVQDKPVVSAISYDVFDKQLIRSEKIIRYKFHTNDITPLKFNVKPIITALNEYVCNIDSSEKVSNLIAEEPVQYGISALYTLMNDKEQRKKLLWDKRIAFCLKERSLLMKERLEYLINNHYISHDSETELMELCDMLIKYSSSLLLTILKNKIKPVEDVVIDALMLDFAERDNLFCVKLMECLIDTQKEIVK